MKLKYIYALIFATALHALPVGDPRMPEISEAKSDIPVEQGVHEISLHTFMGVSKIDYPDMAGTQFSPGFGAGFSYSYFFSPKWGITIGGGLQLFNNRGTDINGNFRHHLEANDFENERVILYYDFRGYVETQWSMMVMVPLMFQYQTNESRNKAFYYAGGAKIGMPFAGSYKGSVESAMVCGYYPNKLGEPPAKYNFNDCNRDGFGIGSEELGFGDYGAVSSYEKLKLNTAIFASVEAGVKWRLYDKLAVYTGFWLDWAVNDVAKRSAVDQPFTWTPKLSYAEDPHTPNGKIDFKSRTEGKAIPASMGFTIRFAVGAGSHYKEADSVRWVNELIYRDFMLDNSFARIERLTADSARMADSIAMLTHKTEVMLAAIGEAAMQRQLDSLEAIRLADIERARIAALEQARLDSMERARILEQARAARLAEFRARLALLANGLDEYSVTQTIPSPRAQEKLDSAAVLLQDYPDLRIRVTGHTCDKGTYDGNLRTGMQRAQSAKNYLVNTKGIRPHRIEIATKADTEPLVSNISEENRRKNRRVQVEIVEGVEKIEQEVK